MMRVTTYALPGAAALAAPAPNVKAAASFTQWAAVSTAPVAMSVPVQRGWPSARIAPTAG